MSVKCRSGFPDCKVHIRSLDFAKFPGWCHVIPTMLQIFLMSRTENDASKGHTGAQILLESTLPCINYYLRTDSHEKSFTALESKYIESVFCSKSASTLKSVKDQRNFQPRFHVSNSTYTLAFVYGMNSIRSCYQGRFQKKILKTHWNDRKSHFFTPLLEFFCKRFLG